MLAEDDADDQKLFCEFLSHRNDVLLLPVAENGVELLATLEQATADKLPDLIVLDQNMPKSNGLQTLVALKEHSRFSHLPVIIYSTYADEQLISSSKAAGAVLVIAKPFSKEGYHQMIETILEVVS